MAKIRQGHGQVEELERLASQWLREHAANPDDVSEKEWLQAHTFDEKRMKKYALDATSYNPNLVYNKFQRANPAWAVQTVNDTWHGKNSPYTRPITTLDIETDDFGRPITISAVKSVFNTKTGRMEVVDTYQRYYKSLDRHLRDTEATHGLSRDILNKLRMQQGADYSWTYQGWGPSKGKEQEAFAKFLGNSILVGHNIHEFDIPKLFGKRVKNQVVDTLIASRNIWGDNGNNSLDQVFARVFGMSMESAGLPHHDSMSDTIATAMIYEAMATSNTPTGDALRKILKHGDLNLAPIDKNIDPGLGGSQLIRGPYWQYAMNGNLKYYVDSLGLTGGDYMAKGGKANVNADDFRGEVLGTNVHTEGPRGNVNPEAGSIGDTSLVIKSLAESIDDLSKMLRNIKEAGTDIKGFGSSMSQYRKAQYIQLLSKAEYDNAGSNIPGSMHRVARGLGIPDRDYEKFRDAATALKESRELSDEYKELRKYTRQGLEDTDFVKALRASLSSSWGDWDPTKVKALERDRQYADEMEYRKKDSYLRSKLRRGSITEGQYADLSGLEGSYEDLVDATDALVGKNQKLLGVYEALGKVKMYDPNQYLNSAKKQASGILGAADGVIPSFLLDPISRIANASFNYQDSKLAGLNAVSRTWNSGIGTSVTAGMTAALGPAGLIGGLAITGGVNAISQIVGNVGQYRMEKAGFEAQNTLNTLGAAAAWISAPFRLLNKAVKTLIGSFSGLSIKLNNIMGTGLSDMSSMGNPLTELTGVGYSAYQGTTMMDVASLFNRGTMNTAYENFANQQKALYTTGEVNQSRLIAASMLGMFDQVYGLSNDTEGQYNGMVNQLLRNMKGQSASQKAQTMYLASQIDSSLPGLLRTANMLGVTDINQLTNPRTRGMYWRPVGDGEESRFRWDQYEFSAAQTQMGVTKMRFADRLWNAVGKELYNGFNVLADSALTGNWDAAVSKAVDMWDTFKSKFVGVWDSIKDAISGQGKSNDWGAKVTSAFSKIGIVALEIFRTVVNAWGQLVGIIADKAQGLIAYLSTVSIKPHYDAKNGFTFEVLSVKDRMKDTDTSKIAAGMNWAHNPNGDWNYFWTSRGSYEELARQLFPNMNDPQLSNLTVGDLRKRLLYLSEVGTWTDPEGIHSIMLNGNEFVPNSPEAVDALLQLAQFGEGRDFASALFLNGNKAGLKGGYNYTTKSPGETIRNITDQMGSTIINHVIDAAQDELAKSTQRIELNIKVNDQKAAAILADNGEVFVSNVRTLGDLVHNNLSIQIAQQR